MSYKLLTLGILSIISIGLLGSSSASALDGFSFSDIISRQQKQREQLLSYSTNPFGINTACESSNPDSTISCNETPFPNVLFNGAPNNSAWGHDGKGVIFVDNNNLVNGNPQLAVAKRGDTLNYSMEIETQRYNDAEMTSPVESYAVYGMLSKGLAIEQENIVVKVDGDTIEPDPDSFTFDYIGPEEIGELSTIFDGAESAFVAMIRWTGDNGEFLFDEDAKITITYTATISDDAPSEVWSRGAYLDDLSAVGDFSIFQSTDYQATALIDGNILIRRVDANGNPLAGAKYTVDGVKANVEDEANNIYVYNEIGDVSEFTTNDQGRVIIKGVPMDEYTVREVQVPQGHETKEPVMTKSVYEDLSTVEYGDKTLELNLMGRHVDLTGKTVRLADGRMVISSKDFNEGFEGSATDESILYLYDESSDRYVRSDGNTYSYIAKYNDAYNYHYMPWYGGEWLSGHFTHDSDMERHLVFERYNPGWRDDMFYLEFNGDEAIAHTGTSSDYDYHMTLSNETGCYEGEFDNRPITMCKDGDIYRIEQKSPYYGLVGLPFIWRENSQRYVLDYDMRAQALTILSGTELSVSTYLIIEYSPVFDRYYLNFPSFGGQFGLDQNQPLLLASEFLFQDKTIDSPETIPNPQTSDAILKVLAISTIALLPAFAIRKHLSRR